MRLPGRRRPQPQSAVEGLLQAIRAREAASTLSDSDRGQLEGLVEPTERRARMTPEPGETLVHHGSYLVGKLVGFTEKRGIRVEPDFLVPAMAVYCMAVAERAARTDVDIRDPRLQVHTVAMVAVERKLGGPLPVEREEHLMSWLVTNLGLRPTEDAGRMLGRRRARRHATLFPEPPDVIRSER